MGWLPVIAFNPRSAKPKPEADHVEEPAGFKGEWVTLVSRNIHTQSVKVRRRGRPILETRAEALKAAGDAIRNKLQWEKARPTRHKKS